MSGNGLPGSFFSSCLFAAIALISGCSNRGTSAPVVTPSSGYLLAGQSLQFSATLNDATLANPTWLVNSVAGGSAQAGTISSTGMYTAPSLSSLVSVQVSATDPAHKTSSAPATVSVFPSGHLPAGAVWPSNNPLVAQYAMILPQGASALVQFGTTTNYGLTTWSQPAPQAGGMVLIYVAGMRANTTYHMQAAIQLPDGSTVTDIDHSFTTGAIPADVLPSISTQLTGAGTPSPGVELLSITQGATQNLLCAVATDLDGNVIWYYPLPAGAWPYPIKPLPNGHMLLVTSGTLNDIREVDLAGNLIYQLSPGQVTAALAGTPTFPNGSDFDHDVLALPNGHLILLAGIQETINNVPGVPAGTVVPGNALIDWDPKQNAPVWTWSTFDHLDIRYAPDGIADWTHGNAVIYSPDDGDLIFSMRNQNWVVKINYANGTGDGSILWRFGPNGDFTLTNQGAPIEWNYGQHYPTLLTSNSSGIFSMMVFNNGNNRLIDTSNDTCGAPGVAACYSSVPIYQVNELDMTASVSWEDNLFPAFSFCCGDAQVLPNGDVEFDVAADVNSPNASYIEEVTQTSPPELVMRMNIQGNRNLFDLVYRGLRIPSLYPGVEWSQSAMATANVAAAVRSRR